ncbi:hypothetical protein OU787_18720 [Kitasatospora sp. YST-16]|uniref:hypothetical protein n=1 Tax=Kitasatospora sp. YST-16 TaxID=2998080 RepID=UPI002284C480|nr:hypothetical protein [Kitasatospora sp. YST-16]WAL73362.1 hypothetical protein OU787_18720 [Kitasatospora sp. YST-16]WNW39418.1 hypothetical protein RKE32_18680 [Streptomyces sp. Li-HN-5-13]
MAAEAEPDDSVRPEGPAPSLTALAGLDREELVAGLRRVLPGGELGQVPVAAFFSAI